MNLVNIGIITFKLKSFRNCLSKSQLFFGSIRLVQLSLEPWNGSESSVTGFPESLEIHSGPKFHTDTYLLENEM